MSIKTKVNHEALKQYNPKNLRKRYFVSEGDLFMLYKEVTLIRNKEDRERCMKDFRKLLKEAQQVELNVKQREKGGENEG
jgi:Cdc6-like AAA superfamily ATPase